MNRSCDLLKGSLQLVANELVKRELSHVSKIFTRVFTMLNKIFFEPVSSRNELSWSFIKYWSLWKECKFHISAFSNNLLQWSSKFAVKELATCCKEAHNLLQRSSQQPAKALIICWQGVHNLPEKELTTCCKGDQNLWPKELTTCCKEAVNMLYKALKTFCKEAHNSPFSWGQTSSWWRWPVGSARRLFWIWRFSFFPFWLLFSAIFHQ